VYEYVYEYGPLIEGVFPYSYTYSYTRISPFCRMAAKERKERKTGSFFVPLAFFCGNSGRGA
jgi:hypothetical protein